MLLRTIGEIKVSRDRFRCVVCRLSLRHEGVHGMDRLVVSLLMAVAQVQVKWTLPMKVHVCIVRVRLPNFRVDHLSGIHFWFKSYLYFCGVWMKLMEVAKRFYQHRDHFEVVKFFFRMMDFTAWLWGSNLRAISCCIPMIFYCEGSLNLICTIRWWSLFVICFSLQSTPDNSNPPTNWNIALPKLWFQNQFPLDFSYKFTVISPSFTRTSR